MANVILLGSDSLLRIKTVKVIKLLKAFIIFFFIFLKK